MQAFNDDPLLRPVSGMPGYLEPIPHYDPRSGQSPKGELHVWGEAVVTNGDTKFRARNKIVGQGLRHLANSLVSGIQMSTAGTSFETNVPSRSYIRVGTGTATTVDATTTLATAVATNPTSTTMASDNPSSGVYRAKFTATWNAGALSAVTVTEIGVFGNIAVTYPGTTISALALFARLSSADAEFTAFLINASVPLVVEYRVVFTFT